MILFYIGTALFAYYAAQPGLLPAELGVAGSGDKIFPYFIANTLLLVAIGGALMALPYFFRL